MNQVYPWLSTLWSRCITLNKPCGLLLSGAPHAGLDRFVIALLQEKWGIQDPYNHPDVVFIEGTEGAIGIQEIRELVQFTQIKPTLAESKFVIIHPMDALTVAAQQSFLKTLEESLVPTYFLMLTYNMNRILATIKSRSQCMSMGEISEGTIREHAKLSGLSFDDHDLLIAQYAPLYHERPDYSSFKKIYIGTLSGMVDPNWDKTAPETQLAAMILGVTHALKSDPMNQKLQRKYTALLDLVRLKESNQNINTGMHLDALRWDTRSC